MTVAEAAVNYVQAVNRQAALRALLGPEHATDSPVGRAHAEAAEVAQTAVLALAAALELPPMALTVAAHVGAEQARATADQVLADSPGVERVPVDWDGWIRAERAAAERRYGRSNTELDSRFSRALDILARRNRALSAMELAEAEARRMADALEVPR